MARFGAYSAALVLTLSFLSFCEGRDHIVGGKPDAWNIPSSDPDSLNRWASNSRFLVGDYLVWKYDGSRDSVLQVNKLDYVTCNTSEPVGRYTDGETRLRLDRSGPHYFISGAEGHCRAGEKLIVVVISERHSRRFPAGVSPAPSPGETEGPAAAPAPAPATGAAGVVSGGGLTAALAVLAVVM